MPPSSSRGEAARALRRCDERTSLIVDRSGPRRNREYLTYRLWRLGSQTDNVAPVANRAPVQRRLGRAVRTLRLRQGLTQEQASAAAGLHPTYLSDIERGARNPSWEVMTRLAAGIGVSMRDVAQAYDRADDASEEEIPRR